MAVLIKFDSEPHFLVRSSRLENLVKKLGQPTIERVDNGFEFYWMYSTKLGPHKYEPQLAKFNLTTNDEREIVELELLE